MSSNPGIKTGELLHLVMRHLPSKYKKYCDELGLTRSAAYNLKNSLLRRKSTREPNPDSHFGNLKKLYTDELANPELIDAIVVIYTYESGISV